MVEARVLLSNSCSAAARYIRAEEGHGGEKLVEFALLLEHSLRGGPVKKRNVLGIPCRTRGSGLPRPGRGDPFGCCSFLRSFLDLGGDSFGRETDRMSE